MAEPMTWKQWLTTDDGRDWLSGLPRETQALAHEFPLGVEIRDEEDGVWRIWYVVAWGENDELLVSPIDPRPPSQREASVAAAFTVAAELLRTNKVSIQ